MERYDLIVIGAGPSGLSAGIEAAKAGASVIIFDENEKVKLNIMQISDYSTIIYD